MGAALIVATTSRRHYGATFNRPPASNWSSGLQAAYAALYSTEPVPADQAAQFERECALVPYRKRQAELALDLPEAERR